MLEVTAKLKLENFQLQVEFKMDQEIFALLGKSGAGKSLTLDTVAGFVTPDRGSIRLDGEILLDTVRKINRPPEERGIGYVLQQGYLFNHLTVAKNLEYGRRFQTNGPDYETVVEVLNLRDLLARAPENLSGGEKQRVALGRALLTAPRLLLLDEPVSDLDQKARARILEYIKKVHQAFELPILYVSHAYREVDFLAQRVALIESGKIIEIQPAERLGPRFSTFPEKGNKRL